MRYSISPTLLNYSASIDVERIENGLVLSFLGPDIVDQHFVELLSFLKTELVMTLMRLLFVLDISLVQSSDCCRVLHLFGRRHSFWKFSSWKLRTLLVVLPSDYWMVIIEVLIASTVSSRPAYWVVEFALPFWRRKTFSPILKLCSTVLRFKSVYCLARFFLFLCSFSSSSRSCMQMIDNRSANFGRTYWLAVVIVNLDLLSMMTIS